MLANAIRGTLVVALLAVVWMAPGEAAAQSPYPVPTSFYNYYAAPGYAGGVGAQLYVAPLPTPPLVGHTYITYEPLMPHEFLYRHSRSYIRRHPNGLPTRTLVIWE